MMAEERLICALAPNAEKDMKKIGSTKLRSKLQMVKESPYKGKRLRGSLSGFSSVRTSLPGGSYRIVYTVQEPVCLIGAVSTREDVYQIARRRAPRLEAIAETLKEINIKLV